MMNMDRDKMEIECCPAERDDTSTMSSFSSSENLSSCMDDDCSITNSEGSNEHEEDVRTSPNSSKVVLVTGGAGFIGSHTSQQLLRRGDYVVVIDEMNDYYDVEMKRSNIELLHKEAKLAQEKFKQNVDFSLSGRERFVFCEGNMADLETVQGLFAQHGFTHICHLAARAGVRPSIDNPFIYVQSNVLGTVTLMELAAQHKIQNFVYASSSSVYGGSKEEYFSESDVVDQPVSQYAATKKSTELFASTYNHLYGLNCTGLRFFTVYGPRGRPDMAPFKFMHRVFNGITIDQYGDGTSERDYTYIDDIVAGVLLSIDKPLGNQVFNLGRGTPCLLKTFISTIEDLCDTKATINVMPMQPGDVVRTCANTEKARKMLGYEAKVPLREGLLRTVEWYKEYTANQN